MTNTILIIASLFAVGVMAIFFSLLFGLVALISGIAMVSLGFILLFWGKECLEDGSEEQDAECSEDKRDLDTE